MSPARVDRLKRQLAANENGRKSYDWSMYLLLNFSKAHFNPKHAILAASHSRARIVPLQLPNGTPIRRIRTKKKTSFFVRVPLLSSAIANLVMCSSTLLRIQPSVVKCLASSRVGLHVLIIAFNIHARYAAPNSKILAQTYHSHVGCHPAA